MFSQGCRMEALRQNEAAGQRGRQTRVRNGLWHQPATGPVYLLQCSAAGNPFASPLKEQF